MRADFRIMPVDHRFGGKIILTPETPEEENDLRAFRQEVGIPQRGRRLEVVYRRRIVGPEAIMRIGTDEKAEETTHE